MTVVRTSWPDKIIDGMSVCGESMSWRAFLGDYRPEASLVLRLGVICGDHVYVGHHMQPDMIWERMFG